jgi:DNA replication and repair protein RecF
LALRVAGAALFDRRPRAALFDALERIGGQVFVTGADPAAFAGLRASVHEVTPGHVAAARSGVTGLG